MDGQERRPGRYLYMSLVEDGYVQLPHLRLRRKYQPDDDMGGLIELCCMDVYLWQRCLTTPATNEQLSITVGGQQQLIHSATRPTRAVGTCGS